MTSRRFLYEFFMPEDVLGGGRADNAKESDFDPVELKNGTKHEMEHTDDKAIAKEIAMDHLSEDPHYYSDLEAAGRLFSSED